MWMPMSVNVFAVKFNCPRHCAHLCLTLFLQKQKLMRVKSNYMLVYHLDFALLVCAAFGLHYCFTA